MLFIKDFPKLIVRVQYKQRQCQNEQIHNYKPEKARESKTGNMENKGEKKQRKVFELT